MARVPSHSLASRGRFAENSKGHLSLPIVAREEASNVAVNFSEPCLSSAMQSLALMSSVRKACHPSPCPRSVLIHAPDATCSETAFVKLVYDVIDRLEDKLKDEQAPADDAWSSSRAVIQSAFRLLHAIETCQSEGHKPFVDGQSTKELLMTVHVELSSLLSSLSQVPPYSKFESSVDGMDDSSSSIGKLWIGEDPWAGEAALATEELFGWFADCVESSRMRAASEHHSVDITNVPTDNLLGACWEQMHKESPRTSWLDEGVKNSSSSLGSMSTMSSLEGFTPALVNSSSATLPVYLENDEYLGLSSSSKLSLPKHVEGDTPVCSSTDQSHNLGWLTVDGWESIAMSPTAATSQQQVYEPNCQSARVPCCSSPHACQSPRSLRPGSCSLPSGQSLLLLSKKILRKDHEQSQQECDLDTPSKKSPSVQAVEEALRNAVEPVT